MNVYPFRASHADLDMVASTDSFFESVRDDYQDFHSNGFFNRTDKVAIYLYQIKRGERKHLGLIATVDMSDFAEGRILRHEYTLAEKEQKMMNLFFQRKAMIKPILLTYPEYKPMKEWMLTYKDDHKADLQFKLEGNSEKHSLWFIHEKDMIARFQRAFKEEIKQTYIADGHHRSTTLYHLHENGQGEKHGLDFSRLFCTFFDFEELEIFEYNRVVEVLDLMSPVRFMAELSRYFDVQFIKKMRPPSAKYEITIAFQREAYSLRWKPGVLASYAQEPVILDTHMLDELVFKNILGIADSRVDSRITYIQGTKGMDGVLQRIQKDQSSVGFCLFPVALSEMTTIADNGKVMPPKSTWFEPRIRNGILVQEF
jgi:uncharacterized protein (DUF1015 family)